VGFNLDDYEPVQSRFARFIEWASTTEHFFSVVSEMLSRPGDDICVFKTSILCDGVVVATGHAEEVRNQGNVNRTSHVENCETSSLGRCLAGFPMHNFAGTDVNKRPSREEMSKVQRMTTRTDSAWESTTIREPAGVASEKQINYAKSLLKAQEHPVPAGLHGMSKGDISGLIEQLKAGTYTPPVNDKEPF
jgi:hypothetical protein